MVLADSGEDAIVSCNACDYAANVEKAESRLIEAVEHADQRPLEKVHTPGKKSIQEVSEFLGIAASSTVKMLVCMADNLPVRVLPRGDHDLNEIKLTKILGCDELEMASDEQITKSTGAPVGYLGPQGVTIRIIADLTVKGLRNFVVGANET